MKHLPVRLLLFILLYLTAELVFSEHGTSEGNSSLSEIRRTIEIGGRCYGIGVSWPNNIGVKTDDETKNETG